MPSRTNQQTRKAMAGFKRVFERPEHQPFAKENGSMAALLVHGFLGTPNEMRPVADILLDLGWSVSVPLLPGFGADIDTLFERDSAAWVNAVREAYGALRTHHWQMLLVGNSMGATIAGQLAPELEPDGLLLFSPFWKLPMVDPVVHFLSPILRLFLRQTRPFRHVDFDRAEIREGIEEFMPDLDLDDPTTREAIHSMTVPTRIFDQLETLGAHALAAVGEIEMPTLILQGFHDDVALPEYTRDLLTRFSGPVSYHQLAAGHELTRRDTPVWPETTRHIRAFVTALPGQSEGERS